MFILLYHGVRPKSDTTSPDIRIKHIPEKIFKKQLDILGTFFKIISLQDAVTALTTHAPLPRNTCVITFDDGYENNANVAAPLLIQKGMPATFFITTNFIDQTMSLWVDRFENAYSKLFPNNPKGDAQLRQQFKKLTNEERENQLHELEVKAKTLHTNTHLHRAMTWDQVRTLHKSGFEIGAHTKTHPILSRCSLQNASDEIIGSKNKIETELSSSCKHFAWPNGQRDDWNAELIHIVQQQFLSCSTTLDTPITKSSDVFNLPRMTIDMGENIPKFLLTISGLRTKLKQL